MSSSRLVPSTLVAALLLASPGAALARPARTEMAELSARVRAVSVTATGRQGREIEKVRRMLDAARSSEGPQRRRALRNAAARIELLEARQRVAHLRAELAKGRKRLTTLRQRVARQKERLTERKTHLDALRTMR